jgi:hypothetical protein
LAAHLEAIKVAKLMSQFKRNGIPMAYKTLIRKAKMASKRSSVLCHDLHSLSQMKVVTTFEKERLIRARKTCFKAMQCSSRLQRRMAKRTGAAYIPELMRSSFKKASTFKRIMKKDGAEAATSYLMNLIA